MKNIDFKSVERYLKSYGKFIVRQAKRILKKKKKKASGKLYNSLKFKINKKKGSYSFEFLMSDHGKFINSGVKGLGKGILPKGSKAKNVRPNRTFIDVDGKRKRSPYKYKSKNVKRGVLDKWIVRKGIAPRDDKGKFTSRKGLAFIIGRAIKAKGIQGISFYSQPIAFSRNKFRKEMMEKFGEDILKIIKL